MRIVELKPVFTAEEIAERTRALAAEINRRYAGEPLLMVCVLKGAFLFFADLVRALDVRPEVDFVRVASYGSGTSSSQHIQCTKDVEVSLEGKHVILVEDIVDTGNTVHFLGEMMKNRGAKSLAVAALVDKRERRTVPVTVDFAGFALSDGFIVGYGLDYAEKYRELPGIFEAVLEQ